jgi:hypothetical protein
MWLGQSSCGLCRCGFILFFPYGFRMVHILMIKTAFCEPLHPTFSCQDLSNMSNTSHYPWLSGVNFIDLIQVKLPTWFGHLCRRLLCMVTPTLLMCTWAANSRCVATGWIRTIQVWCLWWMHTCICFGQLTFEAASSSLVWLIFIWHWIFLFNMALKLI